MATDSTVGTKIDRNVGYFATVMLADCFPIFHNFLESADLRALVMGVFVRSSRGLALNSFAEFYVKKGVWLTVQSVRKSTAILVISRQRCWRIV